MHLLLTAMLFQGTWEFCTNTLNPEGSYLVGNLALWVCIQPCFLWLCAESSVRVYSSLNLSEALVELMKQYQ